MHLLLDGTQPAQPSPMNHAGESPASEGPAVPAPPTQDGYGLAAYDAPSEGRERRQAQDEAGEESQETPEWGDA